MMTTSPRTSSVNYPEMTSSFEMLCAVDWVYLISFLNWLVCDLARATGNETEIEVNILDLVLV